ncbi:retrovirus-related pol polyprotein from transposon TNT 1-94, partial [Tanacetum coccineum]
ARAEGNANRNNGNQIRCYNCIGLGHLARNCIVKPRRRDVAYLQTQLLISQKEEVGIQLQAEEFDLTAVAADLDEIEEVNANCILIASLQQVLTSGTQTDKAPVYDLDGSAESAKFRNTIFERAAKFVRDLKSLAKEVDESLAKHKALELEIERLLRAVVSGQKDTTKESKIIPKVVETNDMSKPVTSNSVPTLIESKVVTNDNVIAPGMFRVNPRKTSREDKFVPINKVRASVMINLITVSQPHVITKKDVNSDSNGLSSTGVDNTAKTRRPQPRSNTKNDRVPSASKSSCIKNKEVEVEEHHRNLLLSKNKKHMSSECNNVKLAIQNDKSKVVCAMCKQCLITANHDVCVINYVNGMNSCGKKQKANGSNIANQKKIKPKVNKPKNVRSKERLASPKPRKPRAFLSLTAQMVIQICLWCVDSGCSKHMTGNLKLLVNFIWKFLGTVRFGNDHVAAILAYGDLQWGNILITGVYFIEGLRHNLFSVGQFCDSNLEVAFRRNTCFVRNLEGVDLLKGNCTTNLYTINLHDMASASPICLMAHSTSTKSWLWHQRLSHLNFDTINDLAKNDLVTGLPKFKYHKEHLCPSCEQGKNKRASHPPKPVLNSKQRLHLLHMGLYGPMRVESINGKRYVLVIVNNYSHYTWVHFLKSKDEATEEIKTFLKKITVLLQAPVIIVRTDNDTEFKNQVLQEYFNSVGISHQASSIRTPQQNGVVKRRNLTLVEAARTMLIISHASCTNTTQIKSSKALPKLKMSSEFSWS